MPNSVIPAQEYLRKTFEYRASDGALIWRRRDWVRREINTIYAGRDAGSFDNKRYTVIRLDMAIYKRHRLVWIYHNGAIPDGMQVDHINNVPSDDRIENLRLADTHQNRANMKRNALNTSGYKGVSYDKNRGKWSAEVRFRGKRVRLGRFVTAEAAYEAYCNAAIELHGEFARLE